MAFQPPFSKRNRVSRDAKEITVREDAPDGLRYFVLDTARQLEYAPSSLRITICRVLRTRPDSDNFSEYPNIWSEVQQLMHDCEWFKVYDIIEVLYATFVRNDENNGLEDATLFANEVNEFFVDEGIGWQLVDGQITARGTETFESVVKDSTAALVASDRPTAATHLREALQDLSRRPEPDLAGAIYHAMGALEGLARDLTGDSKATLGEILKRYPQFLPKPLDMAISQLWGYASNEARHVQEGRGPDRDEAELIVGLCAAISGYLTRKHKKM